MKGLKKLFPSTGTLLLSAALLPGAAVWVSPACAQDPAPATVAGLPYRPEPMTVGFGFGTTIGGDLFKPNIATARFVVTDELQVEPSVSLTLTGGGGDTSLGLGAGTLLRYVFDSQGPVDLQLLAGPNLAHTEGNTSVSITWGASVVWYFAQRFSVSMDALNPLLSIQDAGTTTWTLGAVWNPSFALMLHMFL